MYVVILTSQIWYSFCLTENIVTYRVEERSCLTAVKLTLCSEKYVTRLQFVVEVLCSASGQVMCYMCCRQQFFCFHYLMLPNLRWRVLVFARSKIIYTENKTCFKPFLRIHKTSMLLLRKQEALFFSFFFCKLEYFAIFSWIRTH